MKYKDFKMLSEDDMKKIIGGSEGGGSCSATCTGVSNATIDCGNEDCLTRANIGAFCSGGSKKCCYEGVPCFPN